MSIFSIVSTWVQARHGGQVDSFEMHLWIMGTASVRRLSQVTATTVGAGFIFLLSLLSPVEMVESDPALMLVAAQAVIDRQTIQLDGYRDDPGCSYDLDTDYRTFHQNDSLYYYSTGAAIVSLPVVLAANGFGLHMLNQDQEFIVQNLVSALLVAIVFLLLTGLGRGLVGPWSALVIALVTTLGSPLTSTLATGLWNSCYQVVLICVVLTLVVRHEGGGKRLYLLWIAGILALAFAIRPSSAFLILAIGLASRDIPRRWRLLGLICAVAVVVGVFALGLGEGATRYYSPRKLIPHTSLLTGLYGTLVSPSRGLLVYCPFVAVVLVACAVKARRVLALPGVRIVATWFALHLLAVSTRAVWWGGHCFGPRLMTDLLPGFALLAFCSWRSLAASRRLPAAALFLALGGAAIFINSYQGLFNPQTKRWNFDPNIDRNVELIFSWRFPQFLASEEQLDHRRFELQRAGLGVAEMDAVLSSTSGDLALSGWYPDEGGWRWSRGTRAKVLLKLGSFARQNAHFLEIRAGALGHQVVDLDINGTDIGALEFDGFDPQSRLVVIPAEALLPGDENWVTLEIPGATSTAADPRRLGVALRSLRLSSFPSSLPRIVFDDGEFFSAGFSLAEAGWRWSDGSRAALVCPVPRVDPEAAYFLELEAGTLGRQSAVILLDGTPIATIELSGHRPQHFRLPVPAGLLESFRLYEIEFELPDAQRAPGDERELGLAFVSLRLVQEAAELPPA